MFFFFYFKLENIKLKCQRKYWVGIPICYETGVYWQDKTEENFTMKALECNYGEIVVRL